MSENNTWAEYSKLVLKELENLNKGISLLETEIGNVKSEILLLKEKIEKFQKIEEWKEKISEVVSPQQMKNLILEIDKLKEFKIKAVTIFFIIQAIFAIIFTYLNR